MLSYEARYTTSSAPAQIPMLAASVSKKRSTVDPNIFWISVGKSMVGANVAYRVESGNHVVRCISPHTG